MARVDGSETLGLPRDEVWRLLNDPDVLGASIPGCHGFERDGEAEHRYRTSIAVAIGAVKGVYDGKVTYADIAEPERCTIKVSGRGDKGTIDGQGEIELSAAGDGTEVLYRGEFKLTGPVAGIGQRLAPGVSRKMIVETLHNLEGAASPRAEPAGADAEPTPGSSGDDRPPALRSAADGDPPTPAGAGSPADDRSAQTSQVEPFDPVPPWVRTAGLLLLGFVVGIVVGRIL